MVATDTFTIDAIGSADPYVALVPCDYVVFREANGEATLPFAVRAPALSFSQRRYVAGESARLDGPFNTGDRVGYFETITGTLTLDVSYDHGN